MFQKLSHRALAFLFLFACLTQVLTGCLETRASAKEQDEKQVMRKQMANLQQTSADVNNRFQDVEEDVRRLSGRVEVVETKLQQSSGKNDKTMTQVEARLKETDGVYKEEFAKLNSEIDQLKAQLAALQDEQKRANEARAAQASAAAAATEKNPFQAAEEKFDEKQWREAILDYERYRKANTKGKQFSTATYKIGVSFQELGMIDEAKAFYEEVISKFPKSKDAEKSQTRLKSLKKK